MPKFIDIKIDDFFWHKGHLWMKCAYNAAKCGRYGACNFLIDPGDLEVGSVIALKDIEATLLNYDLGPTYNYDCDCGYLHLEVHSGFKCSECGHVFNPEED